MWGIIEIMASQVKNPASKPGWMNLFGFLVNYISPAKDWTARKGF